ncbi:MAG: hypothetical protein RIC55_16615 [Pirellulaceae bacterium]
MHLSKYSAATLVVLMISATISAEGDDALVRVIDKGDIAQPHKTLERRIDLAELGVDPGDYDFLKLEVKADRGAFLVVSLENYPAPGPTSIWYVLDAMRGPFEQRTIWVDLQRPEELKLPKQGQQSESKSPTLLLRGDVKHTRREGEPPGEHLWIGEMRLVKAPLRLDWDQRLAPFEWGGDADHSTGAVDEDLIFRYPLEVRNALNKPVTARLRLEPFDVTHARAELEASEVALAPGETKIVEARIILPGRVAASKPPLYCERFQAIAEAEGYDDSEVTILRSSDPVHLTVTVPIPEERLKFPLLGRRKHLPADVLRFDRAAAEQAALGATPRTLRETVCVGGFEMARHWLPWINWVREHSGAEPFDRPFDDKGKSVIDLGGEWLQAVASSAYLYDFTGDERYLKQCRELLLGAAETWAKVQQDYDRREFRLMSEGLFCENTLHLGFKIAGTTRPPYDYGGTKGNAALGSKSGTINAFDLVAADLDPEEREKIIQQFILPAGIRTRNQLIGPGNQQCTADYLAMYAGLAARNYPLVSFAYSSEHGLLNNLQWVFDDEGVAVEAVTRKEGYQDYTITPILWMLELLHHQGVDHYDHPAVHRFIERFGYPAFAEFVKKERFRGK